MALPELLQIAIRGALPPKNIPSESTALSRTNRELEKENDNTAEQVVCELRPVTW